MRPPHVIGGAVYIFGVYACACVCVCGEYRE